MSSEKLQEALRFARKVETACLATVDAKAPWARMMEVAKVDDDLTVWFTTSAASNKIRQVADNPEACVVFFQGVNDLIVRGKAEIVTDKAVKDGLYKTKWDRHYPNGGKDDPDYAVMKVVPIQAEFRDFEKYGLNPERVV
jgi:general stress protein 26